MYHIGQADKSSVPIWNKAKTEEWRDFAGAYGIQTEFGKRAVESIEGDYYNVMGLPVNTLRRMLKEEFDIEIKGL